MFPQWKKVEDNLDYLSKNFVEAIVCVEERWKDKTRFTPHYDYATNESAIMGRGQGCIDIWDTTNDWDEGQELRIRYFLELSSIPFPEELVPPPCQEWAEKPATPEEFANLMRELRELHRFDAEVMHVTMDDAMCQLLRALGYGEAADIFDGVPRYY